VDEESRRHVLPAAVVDEESREQERLSRDQSPPSSGRSGAATGGSSRIPAQASRSEVAARGRSEGPVAASTGPAMAGVCPPQPENSFPVLPPTCALACRFLRTRRRKPGSTKTVSVEGEKT
jgi:hypothetical protein